MMEQQHSLTEGVTPLASQLDIAKLSRERVKRLEDEVRKLPQVELPTDHYFADGMYARVVTQDANVLVVGKTHKREHFLIIAKGSLMIGQTKVCAGMVFVSKPGAKRALYALENCVYMTVHRTKKRNLDKIEAQLIEPQPDSLLDSSNKLKAKEISWHGA